MKEKNFRRLVLFMLSFFTLLIVWAGIKELQNFHSVFYNDSSPGSKKVSTFEAGELTFSNTTIFRKEKSQIARYVTIQDLRYSPPKDEVDSILKANHGLTKMIGLTGPPSFLINGENEGFWKSQFYLEFGFRFGGWLILSIFFIVVTEINFRQEQKLFTKEIKRLFLGIYFLVFAWFIIKAVLYGRMIHFLNNEFYLGESITGGVSGDFFWIITALLFVVIFLERAIPIQKEQDLTI